MAHRGLLKQKVVEKIGNICEQKDNLFTIVQNFVVEANKQCNKILVEKDDTFLLESYMELMKILDQCLNSCVMLTAVADTLQDSFCKSMNDLLGVRGDDLESVTSNSPIPGTPVEIETDWRHTKTPCSSQNIPSTAVKGSSSFQEKHTDSDASSKFDNSSVNEDSTEYTKSLLVNQIPGNQYNDIEVYIGNLEESVTKSDVEELVRDFHPTIVRVRTNKEDRRKVFAFVKFRQLSQAEDCVRTINEICHRGRFLKARLSGASLDKEKKENDVCQVKTPTSSLATENDSCYNELKPDVRGRYSLCYPRDNEPPGTSSQAVAEKFNMINDFREVHFTTGMIFVRFISKKGAVEAFEKFYKELDMRVAHNKHDRRKQFETTRQWNKGSFQSKSLQQNTSEHSDKWLSQSNSLHQNTTEHSNKQYSHPTTEVSNNMASHGNSPNIDTKHKSIGTAYSYSMDEEITEPSHYEQTSHGTCASWGKETEYQKWAMPGGNSDDQEAIDEENEKYFCVPTFNKDNLSTDASYKLDQDSSTNEAINSSYLKQLQKIWKN
ncbi:uncharacterized protein LOC134695602 isoform X2 [Mytilus trossulus]|uniref:uncharacterized protein LOC134695602 isoform X2 n=1 Tax=Mytilus trossulus TaxID=6551 RepID=UPI003006E62F